MTQDKNKHLNWDDLKEFRDAKEEDILSLSMDEVLKTCGSERFPSERRTSTCLDRVRALERRLNELIVLSEDTIRLMIASAIAQQPFLMIGPPGVAKTMLGTRFFELLGLRRPERSERDDESGKPTSKRGDSERAFFEYLLHSFSIPEELFGPIDIEALKGTNGNLPKVIRINKNMLTGPGVKACFLDEVFKANSAILNTLLTLINERRYFNDSAFQRSDLRVIMGASNETPTVKSEALGEQGIGRSGILSDLWAFYDRWTMRAYVDTPDRGERPLSPNVIYAQIREPALRQHASRFHGEIKENAKRDERKDAIVPQACINDLIMLGRALILENYDRKGIQEDTVADPNSEFVDTMLDLAAGLRRDESHQLCTINPRKILYGEMVARAHALLENGVDTPPKVKHLAVFRNIWDNEAKAENLRKAVNHRIGHDGLLV